MNPLRLIVLFTALFLSGNNALAAAKQPNVILIMADDFGFECIGANGGQSYRTPNFDRLAATGMRFENCHVQPLCTPTRVQLMTGQYNIRNYVEFGYLRPESKTFANLFQNAGYATCIVGKWQLGQDPSLPKKWGFDENYLWQLTRRPERYRNPGLEINGKETDYANGEYGPELINQHALDFIARNKEKPFLLYYPMILTHDPFVPTPDSAAYNDPAVKRTGREAKYFGDMVTFADKMVGRIADKLDELKIRENTLIIFIGDNGTHSSITSKFRGKDYQGGKGQSTANGTHVPLIANWPKTIPACRLNADLVDSTDFLPTLCDVAGIKIPKEWTTDGKSFWPQLRGEKGSPRQWSYCWYAPRKDQLQFEFAQDVKFKLYRDGRFVDLQNDPEEKSPLIVADLSGSASVARAKLAEVLEQFRDARPAGMAAENAAVNARKPIGAGTAE